MFPNQDKENPLRNSKHVVQNKDVFKSLARTKLPTKYQFHRKFNPFPRNLLLIPALKRQSLPSTHTHTHTSLQKVSPANIYMHIFMFWDAGETLQPTSIITSSHPHTHTLILGPPISHRHVLCASFILQKNTSCNSFRCVCRYASGYHVVGILQ